MLSVAFALVLSQTPIADKPAPVILIAPKASAICPMNNVIVASNPIIARPSVTGLGGNYPNMVHLPPTVLMAALDRKINGCFAPLILASDITVVQPKPAAPSGPGVR